MTTEQIDNAQEIKLTYQIGLYVDHDGFSAIVVSVDENNKFKIYEDVFNIEKISYEEIKKSLLTLITKYPDIEKIIINPDVKYERFSNSLYENKFETKEVNPKEKLIDVKAFMNDGSLIFKQELKESLISEITTYQLNEINHRIFSLFLGCEKYDRVYDYSSAFGTEPRTDNYGRPIYNQ